VAARPLSCPSAQPDMEGARVFAVVGGTADKPRAAYLKADAVITPDLARRIGDLPATSVFRYAARCEESRCVHHEGDRCALGARIAAMLEPVTDTLPSCQIRPTCRWHAEVGGEACRRCPQVVTSIPETQARLREVAAPRAPRHGAADASNILSGDRPAMT
jgi:hypothetical protein